MRKGYVYLFLVIAVVVVVYAFNTTYRKGPDDINALFQAIEQNDIRLVKQLTRYELLDIIGAEGYSALMLAAHRGNNGMVQVLVDKGAELDLTDRKGRTALIYALSGKHMQTARLLTDMGANLDIADNKGNTPLHFAARLGQTDFIYFLLIDKRITGIDLQNKSGKTPLMLAVRRGHTSAAQRLLHSQANIDVVDKKGNTALIYAAKRGFYPMVRGLVHSSPTRGSTALIQLSREGNEKAVSLLLQAMTNVDIDNKGETALMAAAYNGRANIIRLLTAHGANTELRNKQDLTSLGIATLQGHVKAVRALLEAGADPNPQGSTSVRELALQTGRDEIIKILKTTPAPTKPFRYYQPLVDTYQSKENILERNDYYLLFDSIESAQTGTAIERLKKDQSIVYLHYTGALPQCEKDIVNYLREYDISARKQQKKRKETDCQPTGKTYEMAFKWHCYVDEKKSRQQNCKVLSCYTHFVCR